MLLDMLNLNIAKCNFNMSFKLQYDKMAPINALEAKVLDRREIQVNHEKNLYP